MAGVRKKPNKSGKYQAWFVDYSGKRKFFTATRLKTESLRMAERLEDEHRQIRLGYRPIPQTADKHRNKPFAETTQEYIAWGKVQGGRGGRPWGKEHAYKKERHLQQWQEKLNFKTLSDLDGILPRVEAVLRELSDKEKSGSTMRNFADALTTFCNWCVIRGYLSENPLKHLGKIDTTPEVTRRAMRPEEIKALLAVAPAYRRLLYEVAIISGLRAKELRALTTDHVDLERGGILLESEWTKNRKSGFQYLPSGLLERLMAFAVSGAIPKLYQRFYKTFTCPANPLLYVPSHTAREMDIDLAKAGIPKDTPEGKLDFHACRTAFVTLAAEAGANMKELQTMARHSTPALTANIYARTRDERLSEIADKIADNVFFGEKRAKSVHRKQIESYQINHKPLPEQDLDSHSGIGGGGIRSPKGLLTTPEQGTNANTTEPQQNYAEGCCAVNNNKQSNADYEQEHSTSLRPKCAICVHKESELVEIAKAWETLPEHIKQTIKSLVESHKQG